MWVRGLKLIVDANGILARLVAPYVGAWIETLDSFHIAERRAVAPYVGAWIETEWRTPIDIDDVCRTLCGCVD